MDEALDRMMIAEVYETSDTQEVNKRLRLGWTLLTTHAVQKGKFGQATVYCLGWPREQGEHPKVEHEDGK